MLRDNEAVDNAATSEWGISSDNNVVGLAEPNDHDKQCDQHFTLLFRSNHSACLDRNALNKRNLLKEWVHFNLQHGGWNFGRC